MTRHSPGLLALPMAGAVPPPGNYWSVSALHYAGSTGRSLELPIAGEIRTGLDAELWGLAATGLWVPDIQPSAGATFAVSLTLPFQYMEVTGHVNGFQRTDTGGPLGDIVVAPTWGWTFDDQFVSTALRIYSPTGSYDEDSLANTGLNYWTFAPTVAYTHLDMATGRDLSIVAGLDFNTRNDTTGFRSGVIAHIDALWLRPISPHWAFGGFASLLRQISDDDGPYAESLDGFRGRVWSVGPVVKFTSGAEEQVTATFNWAPEFGVENRLEGDGLYLSVSGRL
ncbi:SphA family protein [Zestomonas carbonaria]|nr:transporter [Pseudomonas carbonaria]